jgi:hypothetical protein
MKKITSAIIAAALALPLVAEAQVAGRMTEEQLVQKATNTQVCGLDRSVVSARYVNETENRVAVVCADAAGFVPLAAAGLGGLGGAGLAGAGLVFVALAAGSGGGTSSTNGTQ